MSQINVYDEKKFKRKRYSCKFHTYMYPRSRLQACNWHLVFWGETWRINPSRTTLVGGATFRNCLKLNLFFLLRAFSEKKK
jgi:hypothetical protein